jgi:hypothetical protein
LTALQEYEITTQVQRDFYESAAVRRSARFAASGTQFNYYKLKKALYFGFVKKNNCFIALPEKAFLDALYLEAMGKYKLDLNALDVGKFNKVRLKSFLRAFPLRVRTMVKGICRI